MANISSILLELEAGTANLFLTWARKICWIKTGDLQILPRSVWVQQSGSAPSLKVRSTLQDNFSGSLCFLLSTLNLLRYLCMPENTTSWIIYVLHEKRRLFSYNSIWGSWSATRQVPMLYYCFDWGYSRQEEVGQNMRKSFNLFLRNHRYFYFSM